MVSSTKGPIEHTVEVNIYYQGYRERKEIDVISKQKRNVILKILWLACYNPEIDWRTREVKMMRCPEECGKQWRPKQGKPEWQKQKKEEEREKGGKRQEEKKQKKEEKKKKLRKKRVIEVKKSAEKWEIWNEEEKAAKSEEEAKKLFPQRFHK